MKKIALLGATGSIGLKVIAEINKQSHLQLVAISAHQNIKALLDLKQVHNIKYAALSSPTFKHSTSEYIAGEKWYTQLYESSSPDWVIIASSGFDALIPAYEALKRGKRLLMANKEALVSGGDLLLELAATNNEPIIPIDSEHSAIFQCLQGENPAHVRKIYLTASGGPFRGMSANEKLNISVQQAIQHPVWKMGAKISIDSATMMNKGLEAIEAHKLFGLEAHQIDFLIHPQAIMHSMVEFTDGSYKAQMSTPDMAIPIRYALSYPERFISQTNPLLLSELRFYPLNMDEYPALSLALRALAMGGNAPCALNAANEAAVDAFIHQKIKFTHIADWVSEALNDFKYIEKPGLEDLVYTHTETIRYINNKINKHHGYSN